MAKRLSDDVIRWTLDVNGKPAIKELGGLEQETRALEKTNKDLNMELRKMEAAGKKNSTVYQNLKKQITENNTAITSNKNRMAELRKEIGLTGLTARQLRSEAQKLKNQLDNTTPNTAEWKKLDNQLKAVQNQMARVRGGVQQTNGLFGKMKTAIAGIGLLYAARQLFNFGKELLNLNMQMELWEKRARIVFGQSFPQVTREAEKNAKALGLTAREYVNAASATADLLVPLNFTREQSAKMSVDLVNLSGALDEWTAGQFGAADVSQMLTNAMLGQTKQLKQLGIVVEQQSPAFNRRVELLMQEQNLTRDQAKALDIYNQIIEKSADAQTAFADSSANLLRQQKSFNLFWKELKEGAADWLSTVANAMMYIPDNFKRMMNDMARTANKYLGTSFDVKPLTDFAAAILNTDQRFFGLYDTVKKFGAESEEGASAMAALRQELVRVFGDEGLELYKIVYDEQLKAAVSRARQAKIEEMNIQHEQNARLLAAEQERFKKEKEAALKMLEEQNQAKRLALMEQRAQGLIDEESYQVELKMLEAAYLHARKEAYLRFGEDVTKINQDIAAFQIAMLQQLEAAEKATLDRLIKDSDILLDELFKGYDEEFQEFMKAEEARIELEKKLRKEAFENFKKDAEARKEITEDLAKSMGELIGKSIADSEFDVENFHKSLLKIALDTLHSIVRMAIAEIWAKSLASAESLATFGIAGVAKATALTALVEGAFAVAKSAITTKQAARGRYNVIGQDDGRLYQNVNHSGTVRRTGIANQGRPTLINEQGSEMILTGPHTRNLMMNYPALLNAIMATRVPQRAAGNYDPASIAPTQATDEDTKRLLANVGDAVAMLVNRLNQPIEADISYTKLNKSQSTVNNTRARVQKR